MEGHLKAIRLASKLGSAPFWCDGCLKPHKDVTVCSPEATPTLVMKFPSADMQPWIGLCEPATFGKRKKNVLDPNYRSALALSTDKFYAFFDLAAYDILHTIKTAIMPAVTSVRAELYKLNVYRPGDFFKAHVDTPRGGGMFGSLVVCLPQKYTGGNLVVRQGRTEHAFEFAAKSAEAVCPVCVMPRSGGKLAWATQHYYPHTTGEFTDKIESMLKGTDALTFKTLQQLGLDVEVQAVSTCEGKGSDDDDDYSSHDDDSEDDEGNGEENHGEDVCLHSLGGFFAEEPYGEENRTCQNDHTRVIWITYGGNQLEQGAILKYGNEYTISMQYSSAVIVANIPPSSLRRRVVAAAPQTKRKRRSTEKRN